MVEFTKNKNQAKANPVPLPPPKHSCRQKTEETESAPIWMMTFADTIALMLTFFVMMFAMSDPKQESWNAVTNSLAGQLSKFNGAPGMSGRLDQASLERLEKEPALDLNYLSLLLRQLVRQDPILADLEILQQGDRVVIAMPHDLLFVSGDAMLSDDGRAAVSALGDLLSRIKNGIEIAGHADPAELKDGPGPYRSNWDLSLARAMEVSAALESAGYSRAVAVRGMSSGLYDSLPQSMPEERRLALARRVDIVIMDESGLKLVPQTGTK